MHFVDNTFQLRDTFLVKGCFLFTFLALKEHFALGGNLLGRHPFRSTPHTKIMVAFEEQDVEGYDLAIRAGNGLLIHNKIYI